MLGWTGWCIHAAVDEILISSSTGHCTVLLPVVCWETGRGGRTLHVPRVGHRGQAGPDSSVAAGLRGLVEDRPDQVVEDLPPELEVAVTVFLAVSDPRTPGCVKADEPGLGSS